MINREIQMIAGNRKMYAHTKYPFMQLKHIIDIQVIQIHGR